MNANKVSIKGCGKSLETYVLKELHNRKGALVVPSNTEWYTLIFGSSIVKSREAYGVLDQQMEDFGKQKFTNDAQIKTWANKFIKAIEPHLSD